MEEQVFNIKELSEYLHCSISLIRNLVRDKKITFYRLGSKLYFKKTSIDKWITQQEVNNLLEGAIEPKIIPLDKGVN